MKTRILSLTSLATLLCLANLSVSAATLTFSQQPSVGVVTTNDDLLVNATNTGAGTWTTKRATVGVVTAGQMPLILPAITNVAAEQARTAVNLGTTGPVFSARMRLAANQFVPMGSELNVQETTESFVLSRRDYLSTNGLVALGYDTIRCNLGWTSNRTQSGSIAWNTNTFPHGIPWLVSALASNRCYLGLYGSASGQPPVPSFTLSSAYADGYLFGTWGARQLWIDNAYGAGLAEADQRRLMQNLVMGLDDGIVAGGWTFPVNVDVTDMFLTNRWMADYVNAVYAQPFGDFVTQGPATWYQAMLYTMTTLPAITGPQCTRSVQGILLHNNSAWIDTNYVRAGMGLNCIVPMPLYLNTTASADELAILKNTAAIGIHQDPLITPCSRLTSNATQVVLSRRLMNGDVALGLWNMSTNATTTFVVDLASIPGLRTNVVNVVDCFDNAISSAAFALTADVAPHSFNLYRLFTWSTSAGSIAGGGVQTNTVLTNIVAWYRADAQSFPGGVKTNWMDSAGNFNLTNAAASQPVFLTNVVNGQPAFLFTNNAYLAGPFSGSISNFTIFAAFKSLPGDRGEEFPISNDNCTTKNPALSYRYAQYLHGYAQGANCQLVTPATGWMVGGVSRSGTNLYVYGPGSQIATYNTLTLANVMSPTNIFMGCTTTNGTLGSYFSGYIPEALYYDTYLSSADAVKVWGYLRSKYQTQ